MIGLPAWIYDFHPRDSLFAIPIIVSAILFWRRRATHGLFSTLCVSDLWSSGLSVLAIMIFVIGKPWALIGVTWMLILFLYAPICLAVGLLVQLVGKARVATPQG